MTDAEITKLCAEAMGYETKVDHDGIYYHDLDGFGHDYAPLEDDRQAMELLKKFPIAIGVVRVEDSTAGRYLVACQDISGWTPYHDLNRAICECVAKIHTTSNTVTDK